MDENITIAAKPSTSIIPAEAGTAEIIEDGPLVCPLCSSEIRYFFINFNEKLLMCENVKCEFPFGYEDLKFLKADNDDDLSDAISVQTKASCVSSVPTSSVISTAAWSEIDKINKVYDSDDSQQEHQAFGTESKKSKKKTNKNVKEKKTQIEKNVEDIKGLNMELMEISESNKIIKNEKWIKNLMSLQRKSGVNLLKPEEIRKVRKDKKELKIDIEPGDVDKISSIKIQVAETNG